MSNINILRGQCHCGAISFEFLTLMPTEKIVPRACSCSFCTRHGAQYISDPEGEFKLSYTKGAEVGRYRFGTGTADFIVCKQCGCLIAALSEIEGKLRAVINARNLLQPLVQQPVVTKFDGECVEERLRRRGRTWTGMVIENYQERRPVLVNACG